MPTTSRLQCPSLRQSPHRPEAERLRGSGRATDGDQAGDVDRFTATARLGREHQPDDVVLDQRGQDHFAREGLRGQNRLAVEHGADLSARRRRGARARLASFLQMRGPQPVVAHNTQEGPQGPAPAPRAATPEIRAALILGSGTFSDANTTICPDGRYFESTPCTLYSWVRTK